MVRDLSSLSPPVLFFGSVLVVFAVTVGLSWFVHRVVPADRRQTTGNTAAAYMTALGSLFAILTGFLINAEYQNLRDAETLVSNEAAAATRLAYATEGLPSSDVSVVQDSLTQYLGAVDEYEWPAMSSGNAERSRAFEPLGKLQSDVFEIASRSYAPDASVEGMRTGVGDLTSFRRERIARSNEFLPVGLIALAILSGIALIANSIVVTLRSKSSGRLDLIVSFGIALIVALDLALVIGLGAPFLGPFQASGEPIGELRDEMAQGQYLPWTRGVLR